METTISFEFFSHDYTKEEALEFESERFEIAWHYPFIPRTGESVSPDVVLEFKKANKLSRLTWTVTSVYWLRADNTCCVILITLMGKD